MHANSDLDWERLDRWVRQDGTPDELAILRRWVESDPERRALAEAMRTIGQPTGVKAHPWDTSGRWQRLQRQMRRVDRSLQITGRDEGDRRHQQLQPRRWWWQAAAAAIVVAAGASLWVVTVERWEAEGAVAVAPTRVIVTHRGERAAFDLPDGSQIMVAPESRLRIPATYRTTAGPRDVYLDSGDAYFSIEHNAARPFRVHTETGVAEDLGTEFMVTAYPTKRRMQVVVVSGEVGLWNAKARGSRRRPLVTLTAGELGQLDSTGSATVASNVETARYVSWIDGTLVFDGTRLDEAILTLARWYDLDIRLADHALAGRRLTATIRHQSASRVLESIALSLGLHLEQQGKTIILSVDGR